MNGVATRSTQIRDYSESNSAELDLAYAKVSRRVLSLMFLGYIIAYLDRVNVGFAKLEMTQDLQFSEAIYGLGAGIFFIGYFFFEVPSNMLLHRFGARVWLARIMITWGGISAAMMFVKSPQEFYALRFLLGAAEAGFFPGVIFYLTQWYPPKRRGKANAVFMTGVAVSGATGSVLSGWIMQAFDGRNGWAGWQWLFLLEALPAMLVGALLFWRLTDNISNATWLSDREKHLLSSELAFEERQEQTGTYADAFRSGGVWFACLIYFCIVAGLYGTGFWLPTIVAEVSGQGPLMVGLLTSIPYAVAAVSMVVIGRSADRHGDRRWHLSIPAISAALGLVTSVAYSDNSFVAMVALTVAIGGILTALPVFWCLPTAHLRGATAAVGIAVINSFGNLAGFVAPYAVGWIKECSGSIDGGLYVLALLVGTGGSLVLLGFPSRPR